MDTKTAWQTLRDYAEGRIGHTYAGSCPDHVEAHDSRDPECLVCQALEAVAGAAPAAVAPGITEWYTLAEIKAKIASHDYNAELLLQHAMILLEPMAAPALEAPAAPIQHQGMTIAGNGAAELGKLMRDQRDSRLGVYPDGNPNSGQP
ncbi:hypothetical protein [Delftia sp. PE138]|uniref:hypothetical protein n=1 Tax=Delftia sp. PE138 TaxID=1812483 RepID=UPI001BAEA833|nr:hypothetical protein [Delftia sp. PE138]MBS3723443.1 hypothetical protein [Delftia sp. PE138]